MIDLRNNYHDLLNFYIDLGVSIDDYLFECSVAVGSEHLVFSVFDNIVQHFIIDDLNVTRDVLLLKHLPLVVLMRTLIDCDFLHLYPKGFDKYLKVVIQEAFFGIDILAGGCFSDFES